MYTFRIFTSVFTVLFTLFATTAFSQEAQRIAILDLGAVLVKSTAMQDIDRQFKKHEDEFKALTEKRDREFREERRKLDEQRAIISPDQYREKAKQLNDKGVGYRNDFNNKLRQLVSSRSAAIRKIEKAMEPIVSDVANSVGATMIVEKKKILFGAKNLNISEMVSEKLNKKLPKLKLELVPLTQSN
ncbi:OmpH family outer membrane protein [Sneathiella glossodoripedis]|uniref:OmpH family outer membrane protein n=1 Tax=Sneathiella glossodoripedis TaxID=418853 RepID=UPI0004714F77|nr:OmpH family outer membrane protein [Sneathiella glossodoripedis]